MPGLCRKLDGVSPGMRPQGVTLGDCMARAARRRLDGELRIGPHAVVLRAGRVVAARVAGRFDPILMALHEGGALSAEGFWAALEAIGRSDRKAGDLAIDVAGVPARIVRQALEAQLRARVAVLLGLASRGSIEL